MRLPETGKRKYGLEALKGRNQFRLTALRVRVEEQRLKEKGGRFEFR